MKKTYQKPEVFTEDISIVFAQNNCPRFEIPSGFDRAWGPFCAACKFEVTCGYLVC